MSLNILGIDPGAKGAAFVLDASYTPLMLCRFNLLKERQQEGVVYRYVATQARRVYLELVNGRPGDTPMTAFQFGRSLGKTETLLQVAGITLDEVIYLPPQTWQREFGIANKMDYNERQRKQQAIAQALFPDIKVTQDLAAAILIAVYGWRKENGCLESDKLQKTFDGVKRGAGVVRTGGFRKR